MLLLLYLTSILYKKVYQISPLEGHYKVPLIFGFQKGGNYSFQIFNGTNDYLVFLGTQDEIEKYKKYAKFTKTNVSNGFYQPCNLNNQNLSLNNFHIIKVKDGYGHISGSIENESILQPLIISCTYFSSSFSLDIKYMNPDSALSSTIQPCLKTYPIILLISSTFFLIWIINWFNHFSFNNSIHLLLTLFFLINLIDKTLSAYDLLLKSESELPTQISIASEKVHTFKLFLLNNIMLLVSFGYCFYYESMQPMTYILVFIVSFVLTFSVTNLHNSEKFSAFFILFSFLIFLMIIFFIISFSIYYDDSIFSWLKVSISISIFIYTVITNLNDYNFLLTNFKNFYSNYIIFNTIEIFFYIFNFFILTLREETTSNYFEVELRFNKKITQTGKCQFTNDQHILIIPENVDSIESSDLHNKRRITKIILPENSQLKNIGPCTFVRSSIKNISIPSSVESIGRGSFAYCELIEKVDFNEHSKIEVFESDLFANSSIKDLYIPSSVVELKSTWCYQTKKLKKVTISKDNSYFSYDNTNSFIIGKNQSDKNDYTTLFFAPRDIKNVIIPSFVKQIASCAFNFCECIQKVEFSEDSKLKKIDRFAFACSSITEISIPKSVMVIDDYAFHHCKKLKKVHFHDDSELRIIGQESFANNDLLQRIKIPSHVKKIGDGAFHHCKGLCIFEIAENSELISFCQNYLNDSVTIIAPQHIKDLFYL